MNSKINALLQLIRPFNVGLVFFTILAAAVLAGGDLLQGWRIVLAALAGSLIASGGYAINDYFDIEIDRVNRPDRPLPSGALTPTHAWWVWRLSSSTGVIVSAFLGPAELSIALAWVVSLYYYSKRLKRTVLAGNMVVSIATGLALVYAGVVVRDVQRSLWPALFAFLINLAREIVKDVEDREGDAHGNAKTLPVVYGIRPSRVMATLTIVLLIGLTLLAYQVGVYNQYYLAVVAVVDLALLGVAASLWTSTAPVHLRKLSTVLKVSMLLGLVAIYVGQ